MRKRTSSVSIVLPVLAAITVLGITACGTGVPIPPTPTFVGDAIYTQAYQTASAQLGTQQALFPPVEATGSTPFPGLLTTATPGAGAAVTAQVPVTGGTTSATGGQQACDSSAYVSDVTIPDGTLMNPGQAFTKTWAVANTGSCPWSADYQLVFLGGTSMGGTNVPLGGTVAAGQQTQLSVNLTAPTTPGNYIGSWRLQNAAGEYFGDIITVVITVSGGPGTPGAPTPGGS